MMPIRRIRYAYLTKQYARPQQYLDVIRAVARRGDFTLGRELILFEKEFAEFIGVKYAIGVASGTDALLLILKALGIGAGDEVITAPNSFVASASVIALAGAKPVFADVRDDFTIDPEKIRKVITSRSRAIIPVHLTGNVADLYPLQQIAKEHKLFLIEDCAQATGARYDGRPIGSYGKAGAFSFHPMKNLHVWGDGGMITTNDTKLANELKLWRNHGMINRDEVAFFAPNSRLHTVQAAIARIELRNLPKIIEVRRRNAALYDKLLRSFAPIIRTPNRILNQAKSDPVFTTYVVEVAQRSEFMAYLKCHGVDSVIHYPIPIHLQPAARYLGYKRGDFPVTESQADTVVTLPIHQYLTEKDIRYICQRIGQWYEKRR